MLEYDLVLMSLVIFAPAIFGLAILLFPKKAVESIRWFVRFGAAAAMVLSFCLFIDYYSMLDSRSDRGVKSLHHPATQLDARVDEATRRAHPDAKKKPGEIAKDNSATTKSEEG